MKIIHAADLHLRKETFAASCASLDVLEAAADGVDLVVLSGDIWDGPIANTAGAMFPAFVERIRRLADLAPVAMIYGTPSHDTEGSLEIFETVSTKHGVTILQPGKPYFYDQRALALSGSSTAEALLFGVPEPSKKWLLANAGAIGKDEADDAARAGLHALFLGLGGMRKEHAELPCILLYHGQVLGAKTGTGYAAASGLAVSRDDLAQVGADYIALGDIHEPQQIPGLPAYYPGSIVPQNWGETHRAGCNVVEMTHPIDPETNELLSFDGTDVSVKVYRLDFPHPQRVKLSTTWPSIPSPEAFAGRMVWLDITCTKAEAAGIDTSSDAFPLERSGALPGSRVTLNVLPTETVRAGNIIEKRGLRAKIEVYAENSGLSVPESALSKADELEAEAATQGAVAAGAHLRIDRLVLRGAIGIWKKSRKDEIDLDLARYGSGVLALVGANGAGKTTIIENLHPWPCMLTREGTLKDHFRLRDSCRDLYFTDEVTGARYRALISINAAVASGTTEYFLYRDTGAGFEPLPGINGRKEPYEAAAGELFGSLEMYLRTAFVTQRPSRAAPDLSSATPGQRKALFAELAGIDYLERYREAARARGDALDDEIIRFDATIAAWADLERLIEEGREAVAESQAAATIADDRAGVLRADLATLEAERDTLAERVRGLEGKETRRGELLREVGSLMAEIKAAEDAIGSFQSAVARRGEAERDLAGIAHLEARLAVLREERRANDEANHRALVGYQAGYSGAEAIAKERRGELDAARRLFAKAEQDLAVARAKLAAPVADTCPTCGQALPGDRLAAIQHAHEEAEKLIAEREEFARAAMAAVQTCENAIAAIAYPDKPERVTFSAYGSLAAVEDELSFMDAAAAREIIRKADEASVRIEAAEKTASGARARSVTAGAEAEKLTAEAAGIADARNALALKLAAIDGAREDLTGATSAAAAARATASAAQNTIEAAGEKIMVRRAAELIASEKRLDCADWQFLERATGPNGIQALELDALAPSIANVTNRLLSEAYGSRYQIEFRTTRIAGKGSKVKQVEDFEICILDTESGEEQEIATLSGGEAVWIRKALYDGFGIIRAQNTGVRFQTVFLDEADGALDPEARMLYLRMLEAAHRESGRYQTILITHSIELQAMVETVIDVRALQGRVIGDFAEKMGGKL
jgi:exonuclease SbcC